MLDAFCLTTGYSRKYAIGMLRGRQRKSRVVRKPRRRRYGKAFQSDLGVLWEAAGYICAERLGPFLPDLLQLLEKHRQLSPSPQTRALLLAASTSTISRNLAQLRRQVLGVDGIGAQVPTVDLELIADVDHDEAEAEHGQDPDRLVQQRRGRAAQSRQELRAQQPSDQ